MTRRTNTYKFLVMPETARWIESDPGVAISALRAAMEAGPRYQPRQLPRREGAFCTIRHEDDDLHGWLRESARKLQRQKGTPSYTMREVVADILDTAYRKPQANKPAEELPMTVGSSDVASILGLSPWGSPAGTWARLVGLVPRYSTGDTAATRRGNIMEPSLLLAWSEAHDGVEVVPGPPIRTMPRIRDGWKHCREDGLAFHNCEKIIVEAKTTRRWDGWGPDGTDQAPVYYLIQVVWQMHVLDVDRADIVAYCPMDDEIRFYTIRRNLELEASVVSNVEAWMQAHVWTDDPKPPTALPLEIVKTIHRDGGTGDMLPATDEAKELARKLFKVRQEVKTKEAEADQLQAALCSLIGDASGIDGVATWKPGTPSTRVDVKRLKKDAPEIYREFTYTGEASRRFSLKWSEKDE